MKNKSFITDKFHILAIIFFTLSGFFAFLNKPFKNILLNKASTKLEKIKEERSDFIQKYFIEKTKIGNALAYKKQSIETVYDLESLVNQNKIFSEDYKHTARNYTTFLKENLSNDIYYDAFLVCSSGKILFALNKLHILEQNLLKYPNKQTELGKSFFLALATHNSDISNPTQNMSKGKTSILHTFPIINKGKFLGCLILELNPQQLFSKIQSIKNLGKTGEVILGQNFGEKTDFISGSRHNPEIAFSKARTLNDHLHDAACGARGSGISFDYRKKSTFATWDYIPEFNSGMVVKIDLDEILFFYQIFLMILFLLLFLFIIFFILWIYNFITNWKMTKDMLEKTISFVHKHVKIVLQISAYFFLGITIFSILVLGSKYQKTIITEKKNSEENIKIQIHYVAHKINGYMYQIYSTANNIAQDLSKRGFFYEQLDAKVREELESNSSVRGINVAFAPYAYQDNKRLFCPCWLKNKKEVELYQLGEIYDYTLDKSIGEINTNWYLNGIKYKDHWEDPFVDKISKDTILSYSVPFFGMQDNTKKNPIGVVSVSFTLKSIQEPIEQLGKKVAKMIVLLSTDGTILYHPNYKNNISDKTIFELMRNTNQKVSQKELLSRYLKDYLSEESWNYLESIATTEWLLGVGSASSQIQIPMRELLNTKILLIFLLVLLFIILFFLTFVLYKSQIHMQIIIAVSSMLLMLGIVSIWVVVHNNIWSKPSNIVIVSDNIKLNKFLNKVNQTASSYLQKPPIPIKTGVEVKTIDILSPNEVFFIIYVWQKYHDIVHKNMIPGITIQRGKELKITEVLRKKNENKETIIGWKISGKLYQQPKYGYYPFNKRHIIFNLTHPNNTYNIIPIPDFEEYLLSKENADPWLDEKLNIKNSIETSFLGYKKSKTIVGALKTNRKLRLQIVLYQNIINAFVIYIAPIIVIFFSIFAILWLSISSRISALTGLFFTSVILHSNLRSSLNIGKIIYLEYFFFMIYLTILIFVIISIFKTSLEEKVEPYIKKVYWPLQLLIILIVTTIVFYNW
jgi:hypothetical protein